jgi:hypothetical protein
VALAAFVVAAIMASSVGQAFRDRAADALERRREADLSAEMARVLLRGEDTARALDIVSASANPRTGLTPDDLQWLIERVPAEVLILRPAPDDTRKLSGAGRADSTVQPRALREVARADARGTRTSS